MLFARDRHFRTELREAKNELGKHQISRAKERLSQLARPGLGGATSSTGGVPASWPPATPTPRSRPGPACRRWHPRQGSPPWLWDDWRWTNFATPSPKNTLNRAALEEAKPVTRPAGCLGACTGSRVATTITGVSCGRDRQRAKSRRESTLALDHRSRWLPGRRDRSRDRQVQRPLPTTIVFGLHSLTWPLEPDGSTRRQSTCSAMRTYTPRRPRHLASQTRMGPNSPDGRRSYSSGGATFGVGCAQVACSSSYKRGWPRIAAIRPLSEWLSSRWSPSNPEIPRPSSELAAMAVVDGNKDRAIELRQLKARIDAATERYCAL